MAIIRSISGLRATTDEMSEELVRSYARAFGVYLPSGPIVIGRDGRPSGEWMEAAIVDELLSTGHDVILLGIAPTPTIQLETEHSSAVGGISVTASHNPSEWNGMKFLNSTGVFLNASENKDFWAILDSGRFNIPTAQLGTLTKIEHAERKHVETVLQALKRIGFEKYDMKVTAVVDAVNASGSVYVPALLETMDCETISLYCDSSGIFPHLPEPLTEHLGDLMLAVKERKADIGIAVDPDADRLVLIDENGQAIGEEKTIALCVKALLECPNPSVKSASIALNLSTSMMSANIAIDHGWNVYRSPVGEINVVELMKQHQSVIGGEGSGGVILPECHYGRDSLVGVAMIISLMKCTRKTLSELASELPKTTMLKGKMPWSGSASEIFQVIERHFADDSITIRHDDGIWLAFKAGWMHVRTSNTEPILRFIIENEDELETHWYEQELKRVLHSL